MARSFGASEFIRFAVPSALIGADGGPLTIAVVARLTASAYCCPIYTRTSGGSHAWAAEYDPATGLHASFVTGTTARNIGSVSTGSYFISFHRKDASGSFQPVGRFLTGASFGTDSGNITAPSTLVDGPALDSGGVIDLGRWGTTDYSSGLEVAAIAVWTSYLADATIPTLTTWSAMTGASPTYWIKMEGSTVTDSVSQTPSITGTSSVADPSGFFSAGGGVTVADSPNGLRWRSAPETGIASGLIVADVPQGFRWGSAPGSGVSIGLVASDTPLGFRFRSGAETSSVGLVVPDVPSGLRWRAGAASGGAAIVAPDSPGGLRWRSAYEAVTIGVTVADLPAGFRLRSAYEALTIGGPVGAVDSPRGFRWRSGRETFTGLVDGPPPEPDILAPVDRLHLTAPVDRMSLTAEVDRVDIYAPVERALL